ncbi:unnamed protein product [Ilex paraguariensis]|uniref:Uncharacterized protein n=1 Tax=Ilex paraguariensis TaxID=185542 RepID=A0ABC8S9V3_9AQUA
MPPTNTNPQTGTFIAKNLSKLVYFTESRQQGAIPQETQKHAANSSGMPPLILKIQPKSNIKKNFASLFKKPSSTLSHLVSVIPLDPSTSSAPLEVSQPIEGVPSPQGHGMLECRKGKREDEAPLGKQANDTKEEGKQKMGKVKKVDNPRERKRNGRKSQEKGVPKQF